ncbi:response regulator [Pseudomonas sp. RIT-PI-S]|uniref:response regulator n=1 Tax=Pseudomonas sp. RIT-PI-S TaxID=3035295 RepID=UPI0021DAE6BF|nr:response regulator [Pseudomonas sp. RIT-PI-S]
MSGDAQDVVLIVEDDDIIRQLLHDHLQDQGYHVLEAENGVKAFEILATKPHLDLMITDFQLQGPFSGVDIAEPAVKLRPDLKVIFISGYPMEIRECIHPIAKTATIVAKPFLFDDLNKAILRELV